MSAVWSELDGMWLLDLGMGPGEKGLVLVVNSEYVCFIWDGNYWVELVGKLKDPTDARQRLASLIVRRHNEV